MADERPEPDPGHELLQQAVRAGLMTEALAAELDEWAGQLSTRMLAGELTEADVDAAVAARLERDLMRRGVA